MVRRDSAKISYAGSIPVRASRNYNLVKFYLGPPNFPTDEDSIVCRDSNTLKRKLFTLLNKSVEFRVVATRYTAKVTKPKQSAGERPILDGPTCVHCNPHKAMMKCQAFGCRGLPNQI